MKMANYKILTAQDIGRMSVKDQGSMVQAIYRRDSSNKKIGAYAAIYTLIGLTTTGILAGCASMIKNALGPVDKGKDTVFDQIDRIQKKQSSPIRLQDITLDDFRSYNFIEVKFDDSVPENLRNVKYAIAYLQDKFDIQIRESSGAGNDVALIGSGGILEQIDSKNAIDEQIDKVYETIKAGLPENYNQAHVVQGLYDYFRDNYEYDGNPNDMVPFLDSFETGRGICNFFAEVCKGVLERFGYNAVYANEVFDYAAHIFVLVEDEQGKWRVVDFSGSMVYKSDENFHIGKYMWGTYEDIGRDECYIDCWTMIYGELVRFGSDYETNNTKANQFNDLTISNMKKVIMSNISEDRIDELFADYNLIPSSREVPYTEWCSDVTTFLVKYAEYIPAEDDLPMQLSGAYGV